ncbi:polysaccharide biosynthesis C-terminal domain-containing protein [Tenacibaculum sp. SG-28]|uniref:polysaccharide biosynthesis C-terminal domain-containing protein n=1 Tax=Tenacibaculum sp. SG-28 TaxID=754426 RepID=UPI0013048EF1|nr:polysaccharide biosynthesis C-terminal domain-containing protein [Tenacibaculum sp. SG-28]
MPSFSTYLYPRFCELKSDKELSALLNDAIRLGTFSIFPLLLIGIPYKDFFIELFYSNKFLAASKYLPLHFIGVAFYVWYYVFSQSMTPRGKIKQHGIFLVLYFTLDMLVTYIFVNDIGLYGWMLKHMISPFVFFWVYYFYSRKYLKFSFHKNNIVLIFYLLFSATILIVIDFFMKT